MARLGTIRRSRRRLQQLCNNLGAPVSALCMAKKQDSGIPQARINRLEGAHFARVLAHRPRWFGRSELLAASLGLGIMVLMGGVLAGFGAANPANPTPAPTTESEADPKESLANPSLCHSVQAGESCEDIWELAMAGGDIEVWTIEEGWIESRCRISQVCYVPPEPQKQAVVAVIQTLQPGNE